MQIQTKQTSLAIAMTALIGASLPNAASAATLADGFYDMVINNTPYINGLGYQPGSDGAWSSGFTFVCLPGSKGCYSQALYDDTIASPVNGKYSGVANDGVAGTVAIRVEGGVITGTGGFEFDTIPATAGGNFAEYGSSSGFTGTIDASGNISLTTTGLLGTVGDFPSLVDEAWNVDNFNGGTDSGTNFVPNPPNSNTAFDSFSTGTATTASGTITGAAFDGYSAILVKGGTMGNAWGGFFGARYFEVWNISFDSYCVPVLDGDPCGVIFDSPVPIPAAIWLFGSGLIGLVGVARRKKTLCELTHHSCR